MTRFLQKTVATLALFTAELLFAILIVLLCTLAFLFLGREILQGQEVSFDLKAFAFTDNLASPLLTRVMVIITFFASRHFITGASLLLILYFLFIRKHKWYSLRFPVIAIGSISLNLILKQFFGRERPLVQHLVESSGLSFPSGHAMISASFYGLLVYLVWRHVTNAAIKWVLIVLLCIWIFLIGFSRIYLHVHYATDVIAGFAVGIIWVMLANFLLRKLEHYSGRKLKPILEDN